MSIKSKLGAGVFSLCALSASSAFAAAALTGPPVIDTSTQGNWMSVGEYGTCYNVLPQASPRHLIPEIEIGPDFESTHMGQYQNPPAGDFPNVLCIGGEATGNFDVRIFSTAPSTGEGSLPNHAYAWGFDEHDCVPTMDDPCAFKILEGRAQENACQGEPYPSTFDSDQYAFDPLSAELKLIKGGDGQIAYYFLSEDRVCRSQDYVLKVNGVIVPGAVGTVDDISNGTYIVFDLIDIPDGAVIRLDVTQADPNCASATDPAFNSHMSGIFVNGTQACAVVPPVAGCRFTGGLKDVFNTEDGKNRYSAGGQVGANTGQQPQPKGEWTHRQRRGPAGKFTFHGGTASSPEGSEIDDIRCGDPEGCTPSGDPPSPVKQLDFDGIGTFKNIGKKNGRGMPDFMESATVVVGHGNQAFNGTYHWFEVNIDDLGEPGNTNPMKNPGDVDPSICPPNGFGEKGDQVLADCSCSDFYRITIYDGVKAEDLMKNPDGSINKDDMKTGDDDVIYEVWGYIDGGNLQLHHPTGFDLK